MNKFSQYLLAIIASISVVLLGYYSYTIATDTFSLPFIGQENQTSNVIRVALSKPWIQIGSNSIEDAIDKDALIKSISKNGKPWNPTLSWEWYMVVSGEYMEIASNKWEKNDTIAVSASIYNNEKITGWKLPRNITTSYSETAKKIEIERKWLPKNMTYQVKMSWYKDLSPEDIRWYIKKLDENGWGCDMNTWNEKSWKRVTVNNISTYTNGDFHTANYKLNLKQYPSSSCLVAWVSGNFEYIRFEHLDGFSATWSITDILSPEYDMQTRIEYRFTTDIFMDSGALYSDEYMDNRHSEKIEFLKKISISLGINVTENDLELSPNKAIIYAPLLEWKNYTIDIDNITDIFGRKTSSHLEVIPKSIPSLSLKLIGNKTIIKYGDPLNAKIYRSQLPKNEYEIKLCQIWLEWYARVERMNEVRKKEHTESLYELLKSKEVSNCTKKIITMTPGSSVSNFDVNEIYPKWLVPWLYILAFQNKEDIAGLDRWVMPRIFSIVDTHIVMKIDSSGKMQFLATDIRTGQPRENQEITLKKNISQLFTQNWNSTKNSYDISYIPLGAISWGSGVSLGKTKIDGTIEKNHITLENDNPYNFTSEWWGDYEWRYNSFVAISQWNGHFGYVVSTWNDGITGWNFGMKEEDYWWDNRSLYSAYLHTDRRLYLPGETVNIKAIIRKNQLSLVVPQNEVFDIIVYDPEWKIVTNKRIKTNSFGSIATNIQIAKDAPLGAYSISVQAVDNSEWISNGYTNFQVEVFKNPTFTAEVKLSSPEVTNGMITNIREVANNDPETQWYEKTYKSNFNIEWVVKAHYYNGSTIKNIPFTYRIYKSPHYDMSYWSDCFWWCYYESSPEFYTEWTGSIDSDGFGLFRTNIEFLSFSDDYIYTAEITMVDPLTGESITTPWTLLVGLGAKYKMFDTNNPLQSTLTNKIIKPWQSIEASIKPKYGKWDDSLKWKYQYQLIHRTYTSENIPTLRWDQSPIVHTVDSIILSGSINTAKLTLETKGFNAGEYYLRILPESKEGIDIPKEAINETLVYLTGNFVSRDNLLRVIPEKTIYHKWETAHVLITTPFASGGYLYITKERGGIINHEYIPFTWSTYTRDYSIDESFYPNVYIGVVAFPKGGIWNRGYAVWYSEIIMDISEKKWNLNIKTDKETYKNRDTVTAEITLTNKDNKWEIWELEIMVIDESLIRLLGNIDLDIIPKFFQKYPFTMKTALTAIGIERNRFLSRKWSNGWSGDKGWDGIQISSRTLFQNTAYYNPSIITNKDGKATIKFELPDNVTDYRIIAIGQTQLSQFSVSEKTIWVRRDYTLETHAPTLVYQGDQTVITASVFNSTKRITPITLSLEIGDSGSLYRKSEEFILNASEAKSQGFNIKIGADWEWNIPYTLTLKDKWIILDKITKTLHIGKPPILADMIRTSGFINSNTTLSLPWIGINTNPNSKVTISVSDSPLQNPKKIIESLIAYPYGCIEQTISSTLPNGVALKLGRDLNIDIDVKQAEKNLSDGVAKILRMQDTSGGWKYWESDNTTNDHITPYVVRSLYEFRNLWVNIPDTVIVQGLDFIANMSISEDQMDLRAEAFATLARGKHTKTKELQKSIDIKKLSRHGYLMYHIGLQNLWELDNNSKRNLENRMNSRDSESYWYWDDTADIAIYSRLLIRIGETQKARNIINETLRWVDFASYYISTQTKIQLFMGLIELSNWGKWLGAFQIETGALKIPVKLQANTHRFTFDTRRNLIGKTLDFKDIQWSGVIFYDISMFDEPLDIFKMKAITHPDISVTRIFEKVDESKWLDTNGQFRSASLVTNNIFNKWELYRVRITIHQNKSDKINYYLTLEDYIPGGWRPIRWIFQTESSSTTDASSEYGYWNGWTYVESREDRIFATQDYVWRNDQPYTYTYYIRPEYVWTYLLPPVTAYYMYKPNIHAISKYEKVIVQ